MADRLHACRRKKIFLHAVYANEAFENKYAAIFS